MSAASGIKEDFFIDIESGGCLIQALVIPDNSVAYAMSQKIEKGYVVEVKGMIRECPASIKEDGDPNKVEVEVESLAIVSARKRKQKPAKNFAGTIGKINENKK